MNPRLIDFIAKHTHLKADEIKPELRLANDIGFYGMDAVCFFEDFFDAFEIQNTENFDFETHIDGSVDFVRKPLTRLKNILYKERQKYRNPDVTMGHLDKVVEKGCWFNEQ